MPTHVNALVVMAKAPIAGTVKTRLVPPLTPAQAAELYRALLQDELEHLKALAAADLYVAFTPSHGRVLITDILPSEFRCFPQQGEDLGARMSRIFDHLLGDAYKNVVVIGSDLPALPLGYLERAFESLSARGRQVVLGPSRDGGYYLVGMNRHTPELFEQMTWSHDQVLAQTLTKLAKLGIDPELLPGWFDVDTVDDLRQLQSRLDAAAKEKLKSTLTLLRCSDFSTRIPQLPMRYIQSLR